MPDAEFTRLVKRAAQILLLQRHRTPGVKGWELKKYLGKDYLKAIDILNSDLDRLGLAVKVVEAEDEKLPGSEGEDTYEKARFYVVIKENSLLSETATSGLRVDDLAVLSAALAFLISRKGKAPRKELERLLKEKFPKWKVELNLGRFVSRGYLEEEAEALRIGWRTKAEIDPKALLEFVLAH